MGSAKYTELGVFLRSRRDRIRPADVGLPSGPRRRVPGLRRDEVAQLAGASVEYYIELERGAGSQPSEQMLAALARALRLTADERDYLYHLADRPVPVHGGATAHVHPGMLDLLDRLTSTPAQVITDLHVTLVQNPLAVALLGDHSGFRGVRASFVHRWFTEPDARRLYPEADHEAQSRAFVADLRAAAARRAGNDLEARSMIRSLLEVSAEFAAQSSGATSDSAPTASPRWLRMGAATVDIVGGPVRSGLGTVTAQTPSLRTVAGSRRRVLSSAAPASAVPHLAGGVGEQGYADPGPGEGQPAADPVVDRVAFYRDVLGRPTTPTRTSCAAPRSPRPDAVLRVQRRSGGATGGRRNGSSPRRRPGDPRVQRERGRGLTAAEHVTESYSS
ncbi:MmyB family transcriptional regulator [Pseudonocardia sp. DLS-67]